MFRKQISLYFSTNEIDRLMSLSFLPKYYSMKLINPFDIHSITTKPNKSRKIIKTHTLARLTVFIIIAVIVEFEPN